MSNLRYVIIIFLALLIKSFYDFTSPLEKFYLEKEEVKKFQVLDRQGNPLSSTYSNNLNVNDTVPIYEVPETLKKAFIISEDKRFYEHIGVDLLAKFHVLYNFLSGENDLRGASTITEQVVRIINPRSRTLWSKWIESLEAIYLDYYIDKTSIFEFYLNQVPYASNRRGVSQAAKFYFNRSISTLGTKEILSLVVLVRSPSKFDLKKKKINIEDSVLKLSKKLGEDISNLTLKISTEEKELDTSHFINHLRSVDYLKSKNITKLKTTLDSNLQNITHELLENRLKELKEKNVKNGAVLILDHTSNEVLSWVSTGIGCRESLNEASGCKIDMVKTPRQPGSSLKPFLYATSLEKGWEASTIIEDSPLTEAIGQGLHRFNNYSKTHYGNITLRQALGNSLNIPAVRTIEFIGVKKYLDKLHDLNITSLNKDADYYDHGLSLGSGEVSLLELVRAYSVLANKGIYQDLKLEFDCENNSKKEIFSKEITSLISNILSDQFARSLEFGQSSILNFPFQTAVKTGTSSDYRDSWALGYNNKYVVGIWMGNIDYTPTDGVTGSTGPSLILRSIFNILSNYSDTTALYLSPKLIKKEICTNQVSEKEGCNLKTEYFINPNQIIDNKELIKEVKKYKLVRPENNLMLAIDPRKPIESQAFEFQISNIEHGDKINWYVDDNLVGTNYEKKFSWQLKKGNHKVYSSILKLDGSVKTTNEEKFLVK